MQITLTDDEIKALAKEHLEQQLSRKVNITEVSFTGTRSANKGMLMHLNADVGSRFKPSQPTYNNYGANTPVEPGVLGEAGLTPGPALAVSEPTQITNSEHPKGWYVSDVEERIENINLPDEERYPLPEYFLDYLDEDSLVYSEEMKQEIKDVEYYPVFNRLSPEDQRLLAVINMLMSDIDNSERQEQLMDFVANASQPLLYCAMFSKVFAMWYAEYIIDGYSFNGYDQDNLRRQKLKGLITEEEYESKLVELKPEAFEVPEISETVSLDEDVNSMEELLAEPEPEVENLEPVSTNVFLAQKAKSTLDTSSNDNWKAGFKETDVSDLKPGVKIPIHTGTSISFG